MTDSVHDIQKHIKIYVLVFISLLVMTGVTVLVSYLGVSLGMAIGIALFIATIKASLVACFFMHLISERSFIYAVLLLTFVFFIVLMFLPLGSSLNRLGG